MGFFQYEIVINVLVGSRFIWIPMLWVCGHYKYFHSFSAVIEFRRQITFSRRQILTTKGLTSNYLDCCIDLVVIQSDVINLNKSHYYNRSKNACKMSLWKLSVLRRKYCFFVCSNVLKKIFWVLRIVSTTAYDYQTNVVRFFFWRHAQGHCKCVLASYNVHCYNYYNL